MQSLQLIDILIDAEYFVWTRDDLRLYISLQILDADELVVAQSPDNEHEKTWVHMHVVLLFAAAVDAKVWKLFWFFAFCRFFLPGEGEFFSI